MTVSCPGPSLRANRLHRTLRDARFTLGTYVLVNDRFIVHHADGFDRAHIHTRLAPDTLFRINLDHLTHNLRCSPTEGISSVNSMVLTTLPLFGNPIRFVADRPRYLATNRDKDQPSFFSEAVILQSRGAARGTGRCGKRFSFGLRKPLVPSKPRRRRMLAPFLRVVRRL